MYWTKRSEEYDRRSIQVRTLSSPIFLIICSINNSIYSWLRFVASDVKLIQIGLKITKDVSSGGKSSCNSLKFLSFRSINKSNFQWKALRLLSHRSQLFFTSQPTTMQFKTVPDYLSTAMTKLAKDIQVSFYSGEYSEEKNEN